MLFRQPQNTLPYTTYGGHVLPPFRSLCKLPVDPGSFQIVSYFQQRTVNCFWPPLKLLEVLALSALHCARKIKPPQPSSLH